MKYLNHCPHCEKELNCITSDKNKYYSCNCIKNDYELIGYFLIIKNNIVINVRLLYNDYIIREYKTPENKYKFLIKNLHDCEINYETCYEHYIFDFNNPIKFANKIMNNIKIYKSFE